MSGKVDRSGAGKGSGRRGRSAFAALAVFSLAAAVYATYGFDGPLYRDYGIYLYGGQRLAEGVPPYAGIFDHKGPLPVALAGLGVIVSGWLGSDEVYTVRAVFFFAACLSAVAVYALGESAFRSRTVGFLAALTFLGFGGYSVAAGSGPEPKTPLVLFQALCLAAMFGKRWFWAGLLGALAALTWQPTGILLVVGLALVLFRSAAERWSATARFVAGAAAPLVGTFLYYLYSGALRELFEGLLIFNLLRVSRSGGPPFVNPDRILHSVGEGYGLMAPVAVLGLGAIVALYFSRPARRRFAPLLLSMPLFVLWSLTDFQVAQDFYVFLPYAAVGFGAMLAGVAAALAGSAHAVRWGYGGAVVPVMGSLLLGAAVGGPLLDGTARPEPSLKEQRASAEEVRARLGEGARVASINAPQALALLGETNPNPYLFITDGIDRQISAEHPGGFEGWLRDLERHDPDALAFFADAQRQPPDADLTERHDELLADWLYTNGYKAEKVGNFWLYVRGQESRRPARGGRRSRHRRSRRPARRGSA
ncbi:Hypothetical Protein RradSPS_0489 [Rubrobacter radiotolerans]|uniref:Dolichyl-phosphate-mannose-protein mannosyltransferase n=1 Tax=Rubrobacter radiotolerans TaxID=42256 RepID=A0A023WZW3_RUBRA|nr:hypothetical protein [Rubrobacter radiotolerans]AHY45772.1 Hypothetical Protein RradSPS_0489 [Rubrobacter radiotolerans]MDX5893187.1 hypothetical protein [Rubrobacter radiotolerans]SMC03233.1 hypothetical protein SAMN00767673_0490 [Rubrobacter radiotolerans DSM 5868]